MMGAIQGRLASLEVSEDGNTFVVVGGIIDLSLSRSYEEHERTTYDSAGQKNFDLGHEDRTMTFSAHLDEDDPGQVLLVAYAEDKQALYYRYKQKTGGRVYTGRAIVTQLDMSGELDSTAGLDVTLRCLPLDYGEPSLDLAFAETLSLRDTATETYPVTFTRATSATYVGSDGLIKTAAANEARFDHDPTTGESLGLLIEEQRTNRIGHSTNLTAAGGWSGTTTYDANVVAPDGTLGAHRPNPSEITRNLGYTGSNTVSISFFVRPVSGIPQYQYVEIFTSTTVGSPNFASYVYQFQFDGNNPNDAYFSGINISEHTNGWLRVSAKLTTPTAFEANSRFDFNQSGYTTHHIWGVQFEEGAFPTSYIPTAGAAATRNTDEALIVDANFYPWHGGSTPTEGTVITDATTYVDDPAKDISLFEIWSSFNDRWFLRKNGTSIGNYVVDGGVVIASVSVGIANPIKTYSAFSDSQMILGSGATYTTSAWSSPTLSAVKFGQEITNYAPFCLNGHYKRFTFYRSRLPNLHLQTLTEP